MTYVHVGKTPVPRCIVPSFSDEVFYPGSAPAGVTPQYFTTLNVYQQWMQIFGPDVPLPEDERNLPGYPQNNLYTITGQEGPRYRYCSKERVWKLRSLFPMSKGRFLATCSQCKDVTLRGKAKRRGDKLGELRENLFQGFQPNQDVAAPFPQPSMPMVKTHQRGYSVANLPLTPMINPYTGEPVPEYAISAPKFVTPALGPSEETISRHKELIELRSEAGRLQSRLAGHERIKKLCEANLEKLTMAMGCTREGGEDDRDKRIAEVARLQSRISKEYGILNETRRKLNEVSLAIDLLAEINNDDDGYQNNDDVGYQNNDQDTVLPNIEEEWSNASFVIPEYFDNASEAGVGFAGRRNDLLRFSPKPRGYPPLDEDGNVLSNNDPFMQNPRFNSGLDNAFERESGDGTKKVNMDSALRTLSKVSAGVLLGDSYMLLRDQDSIESHSQQLSYHQTQNPQPQEGVNINQFRALSVSQEAQDQHAQYYQAQSRQPSPRQRFQFPARIPSTFKDFSPHLPCQAPGHNSSYLQPQKATNDSAQRYPLTTHTSDLNLYLSENRNFTTVFKFGQSTLEDSGHHGIKIQEDSGRYHALAPKRIRETAQQAQQQQIQQVHQFQPDDSKETAQLAQNGKNVYNQEAHDELAQEQLVQPTKLAQLAKQAYYQMAQNDRTQEQLALNARDVYDQLAYQERAQQNEPAHKPNLAHYQSNQSQLAQNTRNFYDQQVLEQQYQDQLAQKARDARDVYDQRAYEERAEKERAQQNQLTECIHHAHDQLSQVSQQTQLARHECQEFQAQKSQHQARYQSQPFHSLPAFQSSQTPESAQPNQPVQFPKRRAEESSELLPQSEDSIRRSKRVRYREEIDTEMMEQQDTRAERVQRREEVLELQQVEKATQHSSEEVRRLKKG
ncbi:hypothetical protein BOTCAL_0742g00010 [Botryotinia calthae]|uniref:Uncharacterized protein n=1 Tax=Botryotinia calthae TaxID=38488 RepID=A0A4Y8CIN8_9HELO|nr:hypothetical protein BOTCAL_0742g00010 [Botryotinia calthae]